MSKAGLALAVAAGFLIAGLPAASAQPAAHNISTALNPGCTTLTVGAGPHLATCAGGGSDITTDGTATAHSLPAQPGPQAELIPLELPAGSQVVTRPSRWAAGDGVTEMWMAPFEGPDALTAGDVIRYLRSRLPIGRPYRGAGLDLDWCTATDHSFSWQKPGGGVGPRDRLQVAVLSSTYIQITLGSLGSEPWRCEA